MAEIKLTCNNSLEIPTVQRKIEIETDDTVVDLKRLLRDEFGLENLSFLVFLKTNKKWYKLDDDQKPLSDYSFEGSGLQLDIKKPIDLNNLINLAKTIVYEENREYPYGILQVDMASTDKTRRLLVDSARNFIDDALRDPAGHGW